MAFKTFKIYRLIDYTIKQVKAPQMAKESEMQGMYGSYAGRECRVFIQTYDFCSFVRQVICLRQPPPQTTEKETNNTHKPAPIHDISEFVPLYQCKQHRKNGFPMRKGTYTP